MPELGKAYVQIVPSAQGIAGSISKVLDPEADKAGETGGKSWTKAFVGMATKLVAAAGIGKMISSALTQGGQLQQSIGGIETLFKDSADEVKRYAAEAYKTAGVSANEYMQSVTSFSASLLQGLGEDTSKAAKIAHMAMVDMSDNANKMGTSMESIQMAYQGFAKQNYTMLDNLKLGYGGTKTEMERLLADATKISGIKYDISNLSDVYQAIHVVQGELSITGTTAQEASTTLEGSFNAMRAAWSNLLGAMTTGGDLQSSLQALTSTTATWLLGNFLPMIGGIFASVPQLIVGAVQGVAQYADELINSGIDMVTDLATGLVQGVPQLIAAAGQLAQSVYNTLTSIDWGIVASDLIGSLDSGILAGVPEIIRSAGTVLAGMLGAVLDYMPELLARGTELMVSMALGLVNGMPEVARSIGEVIGRLLGEITAHLPEIVLKGFEILGRLTAGIIAAIPGLLKCIATLCLGIVQGIMQTPWIKTGADLLGKVISGIASLAGKLMSTVGSLVKSAWTLITTTDWVSLGVKVISWILSGLGKVGAQIGTKLLGFFQVAWRAVTTTNWVSLGSQVIGWILSGLGQLGGQIAARVGGFAREAWRRFSTTNWVGLGTQAISAVVGGIGRVGGQIAARLGGFARDAWSAFSRQDWGSLGRRTVDGIVAGVGRAGNALKNKMVDMARNAWTAVKKFFGIHSPSTLMNKTVGRMLPRGAAEGVEHDTKYLTEAMEDMAKEAYSSVPLEATMTYNTKSLESAKAPEETSVRNYGGVAINIDAHDYKTAREVAAEVKRLLIGDIDGEEAVWA